MPPKSLISAPGDLVASKRVMHPCRASMGMRSKAILIGDIILSRFFIIVDGVGSADWDKLRKQVNVSFDGSKTNIDAIHNAIAASGYDTDKVAGNEEAYGNLPGCCQYDHGMEMSLKGEVKADETSNH